ncbi:MAG TPA: hypothetical protein VHN10_03235, partial [Candidatus Acidoferrales bacterium]|nr:hypothetical protein [Candidatus Acidoferrales bacterium]
AINFEAAVKYQGDTQERSFPALHSLTGEEHKGKDATQKSAPLSQDENSRRHIVRREAGPTPVYDGMRVSQEILRNPCPCNAVRRRPEEAC